MTIKTWPGADTLAHHFPDDASFARRPQPATDAVSILARTILKIGGWTIGAPPPKLDKCVVVAAPHTSLQDGFWMLVNSYHWGAQINWLVKSTMLEHPLASWYLQRTGAVPVDRSAPQGLVGQLVDQFEQRDYLFLAISPEGTRSFRDHWKSGFYRIAQQSGMPICLSYLDYDKREAGFGPVMWPSDDIRKDMDAVRAFYAQVGPLYPGMYTPPLLREEEAADNGVPNGANDSSVQIEAPRA